MIQIVKQTDKQKLAMYMKLKKKEIAKMLVQANKHLDYFTSKPSPLSEENQLKTK
jgi:hypothetical protein